MGLIVHVDGGARGNPGPAGAGVSIRSEDGTLIHEGAYFLGRQTNNAAEYHALIRALKRAERSDAQTITVCSDSELLVRQVLGAYKVKSAQLLPLFEQADALIQHFEAFSISHISRAANRRADQLANQAVAPHLRSQRRKSQSRPDDRPQRPLREESPSSTGQNAG